MKEIYTLTKLFLLALFSFSLAFAVQEKLRAFPVQQDNEKRAIGRQPEDELPSVAQIGNLPLQQKRLIRPHRIIYDSMLSPDGKVLSLTVSRAKIGEKENKKSREPLVQLWDTATGEMRAEFPRGEPRFYENDYLVWSTKDVDTSLRFSPDSRWLLLLDRDFRVVIRNVQTGEIAGELLPGQKRRKYDSVAFDWKNWLLAVAPETSITGRFNKPIEIWDIKSGQLRHKIEHPSINRDCSSLSTLIGRKDPRFCESEAADPVTEMIFLPDGDRLVTFGIWGPIYVWDVKMGELSRKVFSDLPGLRSSGGPPLTPVTHSVINPKKDLLLTPSRNGRVGFWRLPEMEWLSATTPPFKVGALRVVFSPNGQRLAIQGLDRGYDECGVLLWNQQKMLAIEVWEKLPRSLTLLFTPDNKTLILAETVKKKRRPARMYDADTGNLLGELPTISFLQAGFSNDGLLFYSLSWDQQTVTLWDVLSNSENK